jgi:uncharacterized protein involved in exopolysaccharide biosynthesis
MKDSLNFLKPYLRGWIIIVAATVLAFLAASKYLNYVTPMYESTAKLRLADLNEGVPNSNLFKDLDVFATTQKINAEIELLKSHTLLSKALAKVPFEIQIFRSGNIRQTELFEDSPVIIKPLEWKEGMKDIPFQLKIAPDHRLEVISTRGEVFSGKLGDTLMIGESKAIIELNAALLLERINLQVADDYVFSILSPSKQLSQISTGIDIIAVDKDVPVIRISFKSSHPAKAAIFPNALAEAYIEDYIDNKYGAANVTVSFLEERISEISRKLDQSELTIRSYRDNKSITNIRQETETDLRQLSQLKIQQTNLKMNLEAVKDLETYIKSGKQNFLELAPNFEAFTDLLSTEIIKKIKELQAEKKDLLLQYTEKDEKVVVIDSKIEDLTSYLVESITNTRKNLQTKYDKLSYDISESEKAFVDVPEKERMMTILNREFEIFQQSYNFLNQKKIEAEIAKAAKLAFHRVITPATRSQDPVSPNRTIIKLVSAVLGMFGAIGLIFIVHMLKGRVNDLTTVESNSMIPVIAAVPKLKTHAEEEQFFLKTVLDWEVKGLLKEGQITCLTGFDQADGGRFISGKLAACLATQGRRVLLVHLVPDSVSTSGHFLEEQQYAENQFRAAVSPSELKAITVEKWKNQLHAKAAGFDQTIILNSDFGQAFTLGTMAAAKLNIVCLDTRLTPAKCIVQADLIREEFQVPNMAFVLNRVGYSPNFVREVIQFGKSMVIKLRLKLK